MIHNMSIVETALASTGSSIALYSMFYLFKKCRDKTKVRGCLVCNGLGKSYAEKNLSQNNLIYIDLDGSISLMELEKVQKNEKRLKIYPSALEKIREYKNAYRNHVIVLMSSDFELLQYLGLEKKMFCLVPSPKFFVDNENLENRKEIENQNLNNQLKVKKKRQLIFDNWDDMTKLLKQAFLKK